MDNIIEEKEISEEEIKELKKEEEIIQDEDGNIINLTENNELETMGKGDEEDDK